VLSGFLLKYRAIDDNGDDNGDDDDDDVVHKKEVRTSICIAHTVYCTPLMRSRH